jgi:hypothetical protein
MDLARGHEMPYGINVSEPKEKRAAKSKNVRGPRQLANAKAEQNAVGLMVPFFQTQNPKATDVAD